MYLILIFIHSVKHNILVEAIFMLEDVLFLRRKVCSRVIHKKILSFYATRATSKICKKKLLQCNHTVCLITIQHMMLMVIEISWNPFWKRFRVNAIQCISDMYYEYVLSYVLSYYDMYCKYNVMNENIFTDSNVLDIHIHRIIPTKKLYSFRTEKYLWIELENKIHT